MFRPQAPVRLGPLLRGAAEEFLYTQCKDLRSLPRLELLAEDTATEPGRRTHRLEVMLSAWLRDVRQMIAAGTLKVHPPLRYGRRVESEANAREAARWLRKAHRIGTEPIETLMEFSERGGQYVLVTDLPGEGASMVDGDVAAAVVSTQGDPGRRRTTAAHEQYVRRSSPAGWDRPHVRGGVRQHPRERNSWTRSDGHLSPISKPYESRPAIRRL